MKTYIIYWTYVANYGGPMRRHAESPEEALQIVYDGFSDDFRERGSVTIFDCEPVLVVKDGKVVRDADD